MATQQGVYRPQIMVFAKFLENALVGFFFPFFCIQKNSQNADIVKLFSCNFNREICKCWFCTLTFFEDTLC